MGHPAGDGCPTGMHARARFAFHATVSSEPGGRGSCSVSHDGDGEAWV